MDSLLHSFASLAIIFSISCLAIFFREMISDFQLIYKQGKCGFLSFITGSYLAPQNCKVIFDWKTPSFVANHISFSIKRNFKPYPITQEDQLSVHITNGTQAVPCSIEFGDRDPSLANVARVSFSPKKSGNYSIHIVVRNALTHIRGSPFTDIFFKPLNPSPYETLFLNHCSTVVCTQQSLHSLMVEMRDRFGNLCDLNDEPNEQFDASNDFSVVIVEIITKKLVTQDICYYWQRHLESKCRVQLAVVFPKAGIYHVRVSYKGSVLKNGDFNVVCLTEGETEQVNKCTRNGPRSGYFNAKLLPSSSGGYYGEHKHLKPKNVVVYISPKQLTIKEYILKIIPIRIATFRLLPSTKFYFAHHHSNSEVTSDGEASTSRLAKEPTDLIIIDDGCQTPVELSSADRNIIVAVFTSFLLNRIGGSDTFRDKQEFFYSEVRYYHQRISFTGRVHLKINRENILDSSVRALKHFGTGDWCKIFEIEFLNEYGLDWGGVRREWYELLCKALFNPQNNCDSCMFMRFKNDRQGLIHPNPNSNQKLSMYEFAGKIVGKTLLDSAFGATCKCLVSARFTRSFLAQWIGLRVNYRYFEQDDPDLYVSKIKFILENDVSELDLYFVEEEYDKRTGKLLRTFDLIPNGSNIKVTEENKIRYLDSLAQFRLSTSVKEQVEAFLKGLNDLIPDHLLSIFDENEIELLVCGAATYSVSDLRQNHVVTCAVYDFQKVVDWFWKSLATFTEEEFARLLQFTTGCSTLPPGGFAELNPRFQITSALTYRNLPTAHTCFNQICLPDFDSFEDFDRALRIAITEGSEGFGLA